MPLPFFIPIALGIAGLFGAGKAVKGVIDNSDAKDIMEEAKDKVDSAQRRLVKSKKRTNKLLTSLGKEKVSVMENELPKFVSMYERVGEIDPSLIQRSKDILGPSYSTENLVSSIQQGCDVAKELSLGLVSGTAAAAVTALAAYGGTMAFAAAGTGAAISSLSGAAAANATLAWLGGGTLAAGGLGILGGTVVLGLLVAGPLLAIFGSIFGSKASENLDNAKSARQEARTFVKQTKIVIGNLKMTDEIVNLAKSVLVTMSGRLSAMVTELNSTLDTEGVKVVNEESFVQKLFVTIKTAQVVKAIIETPILDNNDGSVLPNAESKLNGFLTD
jgi:hypothetical protein